MIEVAQLVHGSFCKEDLSATLEMTAGRSAIKTPRRLIIFCAAPPLLTPHPSLLHFIFTDIWDCKIPTVYKEQAVIEIAQMVH